MVALPAPAGFIDEPPLPKRKPLRASPELIAAMIEAESGGDPAAISPAGAAGLMQLMPGTARDRGVADVFDPEQNVRGGSQQINNMLARYGDPELALMAYNWGPGNVDRWIAGDRKGQVPAETRAYVARLLPVARGIAGGAEPAGAWAQPAPAPASAFTPAPGPLAAKWRQPADLPPTARNVVAKGPSASPALPAADPRFASMAAGGAGFNTIPATMPAPQAAPTPMAGPVAGPAGPPPAPPGFVDEGEPQPPPGFVDEDQVPAPAAESGFISEFKQSFLGGLTGTNGIMLGEALQVLGRRTGYDALVSAGQDIAAYGRSEAAKYPARVPSIENIRTDSVGHLANDTLAYLGSSGGQGTSSMLPTIVAGLVVGAATRNPYAGLIGGAAGPSYLQNLGDISTGLKDELAAKVQAGEISQKRVDDAALLGAIPMAALDLVGVGYVGKTALGGPRKELRRRIVKFIAGAIVKNTAVEGITEGLQELVSQWTQAYLGDAPLLTRERLVAVVDNLVGGAIPGAIFGAGGGAVNVAREAVKKPQTEPQPEAADHPQPESAAAGPAAPPAPPAGSTTAEAGPGAPQTVAGELVAPGLPEAGQEPGGPQAPAPAPAILQPKGAPAPGATVRVTNPALEEDVGQGVVEAYVADDTGAPVAQVRLADGDLAEYQVGLHTFETLAPPADQAGGGAGVIPGVAAVQPTETISEPPKIAETATSGKPDVVPGTAAAPIEAKTEADIAAAGQNVETAPTEKQKVSGVYEKGHVRVQGLDIAIENPKGSVRSGKAPRGKTWSVTMPAAYGYIKRSEGADGDQVDVYLGPKPQSERVFVIEQKNLKTGKFDEHKVMIGFASVGAARKAYVASFSDGKGNRRIMSVTQFEMAGFKEALAQGRFKKRKARQGRPGTGGYRGRESLLVFIARLGGMKDPTGKLRAMDAHKWRKPFLKSLIQEMGQDPDKAREAAAEAGYIKEDATLADFYEAVDHELRGNPIYPPHIAALYDAEDAQAQGADQERHDLEREAELLGIDVAALGKIDNEALKEKIAAALTKAATPETADAVGDIIEDEGDRLEREAIAGEESLTDEEIQAIADAGDPGQIPGDEAQAADQHEEAGQDREAAKAQAVAGHQEKAGPRPGDAQRRGEAAPKGPERPAEGVTPPATETTDQGEQIVLPGAERTSGKEFVEAQADKRIKGKKPQKPADEGLFDTGARRQQDIFNKPTDSDDGKYSLARTRRFGIPKEVGTPVSSYTTDAEIKAHRDYTAAKAGNQQAAERMVADLVKPETIEQARERFGGDVVYVPVIAVEASGDNAIPWTLAGYYAEATGADVTTEILQVSTAFHTGAKPLERILARPLFEGPVEPGRRYVLVDDVTVMGGTLAELANHIRQAGGEVAGAVTLVNASRGGIFTPRPNHIGLLEARFGDQLRNLGIEPSALTGPEATYLAGFKDADQLRTAVANSESNRRSRLRAKGLLPPENQDGNLSLPAEPDTASGAPRGPEVVRAITEVIADELRRIAPDAKVDLVPRLIAGAGAEASGGQAGSRALGRYLNGVITLAYESLDSPTQARAVAGHEGIHFLRDAGFFTKDEWATLEAESRKSWIAKHNLLARPGDDTVVEEGIAYEYQDWRTNQRSLTRTGPVHAIFRRMLMFLRRLGNALRLRGFQTAQDIFARVASGEVGRRAPGTMTGPGGERYAMDRTGETPAEKHIEASQKRHASTIMETLHNRVGWMFDPLGKLPEAKKYLGARYRTLGRIAKVEELARGLYDVFAGATAANQKAAYDFLTTRGARTAAIQDPKIRDHARRAKQQIDQVGRDLVRQGLLTRETYEAHRGEYLPRVYLKHLLGGPNNFGKGAKVSDLGYLKQRKDIPESVRQLILGEITDPGFLAAKGVSQPMRDMAILQFLEQIAGNKAWVFPKSLIQWEGKNVSLIWLAQESTRIADQAAYIKDKDLAAASLALARKMGETAEAALAKIGKVPDNYRQVPDAKRYGRLRGMWVRKEIYDDLIGSIRMLPADDSIAERVLGHGGIATKATQIWKLSKVALNPPTQVRNFMSNAVLLHLSGVPLWRLPGRIVQAAREMAHDGEHWKIAKKYGITATTFSNTELLRIEREMLDIYGHAGAIGRLRRIGGLIANFAGDTYQLSESLFKTAKIIDAMAKGMAEEEAALEAQKWLFDYSLVAPSVRYLRSAPVGVPFLCVDETTEILTGAGWKTIDTVREGDLAASFDMESETLKWKPVLDIYRAPYDGPMVHVEDRHLDMLLTPDHRCVTYRRRRLPGRRTENAKHLSLELQQARKLKCADHIPTAAEFEHDIPEVLPDALVSLLGWVATEGSLHPKCAQVIVYQSEGPKADEIRRLIGAAGGGFYERRTPHHYKESVRWIWHFYIHAALGRVIRALLPDKQLTPALLMRLSKRQIGLLVDAMIAGDGSVDKAGRKCFIQNPGQTLEAFQMALTILGKSYSVRKHDPAAKAVLIRDGRNYCVKRARRGTVAYAGRIWCPRVADTGTWVARRNGKPFITHNTFYTKALPRIVETAVTAPWRYLPYVILPIVLSQMIANEYDVDDEDIDKLKMALPEWMRNKSNVLFLPYKDEFGRWQAFDLGYMYPWGMYQEFYNEVAKGQAGEALGTTGLLGGPLPDLIAAVKTGIDPFTKRPIANEFDPPARQVADIMQYLWRMAAPTWITDIGFAGHMYRTLTGTVNAKTGAAPLTLPQSAARLFGTNIYPIEPEASLANNIRWMRYDIQKTQQRARQMLRNPNLDDTERKNIETEYGDLITRKAQQMQEYIAASQIHPNLTAEKPGQ